MKAPGYNIRVYRNRRKLSQSELADKVAVTTSAISNYENGHRKPNKETAARIAEVLSVDITDLYRPIGTASIEQIISDTVSESPLVREAALTHMASDALQDRFLHEMQSASAYLSEEDKGLIIALVHDILREKKGLKRRFQLIDPKLPE